MEQLSSFIVNHWMLVTAFCVVAGLLLANLVTTSGGVSPQHAVTLINREGAVVVDIRAPAEFAQGHVNGAVNLPQAELASAGERLARSRDQVILVCCASGASAAAAARQLRRQGFAKAQALAGGLAAWRTANLPVTTA